jgi:hypothetical protein
MLVGVLLTSCYVACAFVIWKKLSAVSGSNKRQSIRVLTWRVVSSSLGYFVFIAASISLSIRFRNPWVRQIITNLGFIGWAAVMQVLATRPHGKKSASDRTPSINHSIDLYAILRCKTLTFR